MCMCIHDIVAVPHILNTACFMHVFCFSLKVKNKEAVIATLSLCLCVCDYLRINVPYSIVFCTPISTNFSLQMTLNY